MSGLTNALRGRVAALLAGTMMVTGIAAGAASLATPVEAQEQELQKVRIGVATTFLGITYPWLMMPQALGYWEEEGYDVEVLPIGGSLQVVQQMVGGGVEIGQVNSSVVIQSRATNDIPIRAFMTNGVIDWSIAVPEESEIQEVTDLEGKKIGVFNLASGGIPFLKAYLQTNGIDPDTEVELIPLGFGAPVVQAIRSGQVDAVMYWASANAGFENAGLSLRYLFDKDWRSYPDFSMAALQPTIDADLEMLEAIARGAAKATVFALANPDCVRQIQWENWPDTKPTGAEEATLIEWDLNSLGAQLETLEAARALNESGLWGDTSAEAFGRMQDFLLEAGLIEETVDPSELVIADEGFFERVNDFDHEAIIASAEACEIN